ncbi:flagellar basal body P-ring formation chaperone FlgA [Aureimonas mangrovi]|uniref:flagellar basal body P-ring formation chaperone FlgA n=1 Tax=Aureimonas mangrovi TaxID=2758041 RepID=UPI00163D52D5|nr:flagellar basal body P-ring formation chaperone FlgA [Aureimonas mangrovi]
MSARATRERLLAALYGAAVLLFSLFLLAVPVRAFSAEIDLPVPTAVVYPGQSILDRGVIDARFSVPGASLSSYVVERGMLRDKIARRTLLPGKPIMLSDLKSPDIVRAGVPTNIVYREPGLMISAVGLPLASAGEGDMVRVRNVDSGVTISGLVSRDGTIEIVD